MKSEDPANTSGYSVSQLRVQKQWILEEQNDLERMWTYLQEREQ